MEIKSVRDILVKLGIPDDVALKVADQYKIRGSGSALAELYLNGWVICFNMDRSEFVMKREIEGFQDSISEIH
jgi:hypothetical protein